MCLRLFFCLLIFFLGCSGDIKKSEILRIASLERTYDVVIVRVEVGATVSSPYEIYVVEHNGLIKEATMIARIDGAELPSARWIGNRTVELTVKNSRIFFFKNFSYVKPDGDSVKIDLIMGPRVGKDCNRASRLTHQQAGEKSKAFDSSI